MEKAEIDSHIYDIYHGKWNEEPLGTCNGAIGELGAIRKLAVPQIGCLVWPIFADFLGSFLTRQNMWDLPWVWVYIVQELSMTKKAILSEGKTLVPNGSRLTWSH